ncbi:von Willebrand factor D and EGF domain-containing protein-like [Mytilus edulis]|uniref:von Willebrand factor D and EGF domain-containing protein-like n=1 Tax=Mytilus edulis TaxID=6550 RepID=UPI0039F130C7
MNDSTVTKLLVDIPRQSSQSFQIDYHQTKSYIYWVDPFYGTMHRTCYPCYDNERMIEEIVPKSSLYHPISFAIDSEHDHIYWSDRNYNAVIRSNLDGLNETVIINSSFGIGHLTIDQKQSWIYFMDNEIGSIERCSLDGYDQVTVISDSVMTKKSRILLDFDGGRILWSVRNMIRSAFFNGSDVQEIKGYGYRYSWYSINGIAVHNDYLYYTDNWGRYVNKVDRFGSNFARAALVHNRINDLKIYHGRVVKDPCVTHTKLVNAEKRSTGFFADWTSEESISDDILEEGWYRIYSDNGGDMPTRQLPGTKFCGTTNPFWLNGTLPTFKDGNMTVEACMQTNQSICEESVYIMIRNCDGYNVYYLRPTPAYSAYCFGSGPVHCPASMSSETEYYPGCSSNYPTNTVTVEVEALLTEGEIVPIPVVDPTPSLIPIFKCQFEDKSNGSYAYDVYWLICGNVIKYNTNLLFKDITDAIILKETDWHDKHKMNMEVKCAIRMRNSRGSTPGPYLYTSIFRAGLYSDRTYYTVTEGESINITFTSTVPVGCISSHPVFRSQCDLNFYLLQPYYSASTCINNVIKRDIVFKTEFCGIRVGNLDWMEKRTLQVYGYNDGMYNTNNRYAYIRLSTSSKYISTQNNIWRDVHISQIRVNVVDKDSVLKNRLCQSYNDPHFRTFDGAYYDYMGVGEFVMYRNDIGPYWVHALFTSCGSRFPGTSCICGIAIRSKESLFILRTCEQISRTDKNLLQQPVVSLTTCNKTDMVIENTNNNYKIILPIATEIQFSIARRFISVISIKPAVKDINTSKGLCGVPSTSKDPSDDFTHRDYGPINDVQIFADSWRISSEMVDEQLFNEEPEFLKSSNDEYNSIVIVDNNENNPDLATYCSCDHSYWSTDSLDDVNSVKCNLTESTEQCTEPSNSFDSFVQYDSCFQPLPQPQRRRRSINFPHKISKRSLNNNDDVVDFKPLIYSDDVNGTEIESPATFRNGWTSDGAYTICFNSINDALQNDMYKDYVNVPVDKFIEACVKDIEVAGDTTFLTDTVNAMVTSILTELVKTESLYTKKSADGSQSLLEYFASGLCPNKCSDNGLCKSGVCSCDNGHVGEDCSYNTSSPPSGISLPFDGECKLTIRACEAINVFGEFVTTTVWCKRRHFQILENDLLYTQRDELVLAKYRNPFMLTLNLPASRKKRSVDNAVLSEGYDISFSYDGQNFGEETSIIIYDDLKYSCNITTKTCISLIVDESAEEAETEKDVIKIVVAVTVSVVVILVIIGVIHFKLMTKVTQAKVACYGDELDQKKTSSDNGVGRENTVSELEFDFKDNTDDVYAYAMQCPPRKENIGAWNGGFKTFK